MDAAARQADVAIIGGGPIGLELAVGLQHANVKYVQFEAGPIGSTIGWWAPGTKFFSSPERIEIAGVPLVSVHEDKATREEYLAYLRGVVRQFALEVQTYRRVIQIQPARDRFELTTQPSVHGVGGPAELRDLRNVSTSTSERQSAAQLSSESHWSVQRVILAVGNMHQPRLMGVPGENLSHVSHYLYEPHAYFRKRVLIVGGKNSAVEAAIRLYRCGAKVILSYRGSEFDAKRVKYWLRPELEWLISKGMIEFHPQTVVKMIHSLPGPVELVSVAGDRNARKKDREIEADFVLALTGYIQDSELFEQLGVELVGDERHPRFDLHTMKTNIEGVHVAGTAAGGSQQRAKLFIENSHTHVRRIVQSIAGVDVPWRTEGDFGALET